MTARNLKNAKVNPVFGTSTYNCTGSANTPVAVMLTGQSTVASFTFAALTPRVPYTITGNALARPGPRNWRRPGSQIAV